MQKMFQRKKTSRLEGKAIVKVKTITTSECSRHQCSYNKHNHKRLNVLKERTTKEQKYCKLGEGGKLKKTMVKTIQHL